MAYFHLVSKCKTVQKYLVAIHNIGFNHKIQGLGSQILKYFKVEHSLQKRN